MEFLEEETIIKPTLETVLILWFGGLKKKTHLDINSFGGVSSSIYPQTLIVSKTYKSMFHCTVSKLLLMSFM